MKEAALQHALPFVDRTVFGLTFQRLVVCLLVAFVGSLSALCAFAAAPTLRPEAESDEDPADTEFIHTLQGAAGLLEPSMAAKVHPAYALISQGKNDEALTLLNGYADAIWRDLNGFTLLHVAAVTGAVQVVNRLLDLNARVDAQDFRYGLTPLDLAVLARRTNAVEVLLKHGADPNLRMIGGFTSAHLVAGWGSVQVLELLLKHGVNCSLPDDEGTRPIHVAASRGRQDIVEFLLRSGVSIQSKDHNGDDPLHLAARGGNLNLVRWLIDEGADVDSVNKKRRTPLLSAAYRGDLSMAQTLVEHGARVAVHDLDGWTPFLGAVTGGRVAMMEFLAKQGADVREARSDGTTPLIIAAVNGREDAAAWLLDQGCDVNATDQDGITPVYDACAEGFLDMAELLVNRGGDVNQATTNGWTPLCIAVIRQHDPVVAYLLAHEADVKVCTKDLYTPLHMAAGRPSTNILQALVAAGADVNARDDDGWTPLLTAVAREQLENVNFLLSHGADVNAEADKGRTALTRASTLERSDIAAILLEHGARTDARVNGWTPLHEAAWFGRTEIASNLLAHGADINARTEGGQHTALMVAARRGNPDIASLLIRQGEDLNAKDRRGLSAWHYATMIGRTNVASMLEAKGGTPDPKEEMVPVCFQFDDPKARAVFVAGTFNEWDPKATALTRDSNGIWSVETRMFCVPIAYKFVVDGQWITDPANPVYEYDVDIKNSLIVVSNAVPCSRTTPRRGAASQWVTVHFTYTNRAAEQVYVAGEFNSWNTTTLPMDQNRDGVWYCDARVPVGDYGYKFVVDGEWMLDPGNPLTKTVGDVLNSRLVVASPTDSPVVSTNIVPAASTPL